MEIIDCRGMACPGPVIQTKKALEELRPLESVAVEVDSEASMENVRRFAESRGSGVRVEEIADNAYRIVITAPEEMSEEAPATPPVIFISSETVGSGDDKLGTILMDGFINTLLEQEKTPDSILLMNGAVRLAVEGSAVVVPLKCFSDIGCEILVCGTCLDFFGLKEKLAVGTLSNMYDIQHVLLNASSVIRL